MSEANPTPAPEPVLCACGHHVDDHWEYGGCRRTGTASDMCPCRRQPAEVYAAELAKSQRERDEAKDALTVACEESRKQREFFAALEWRYNTRCEMTDTLHDLLDKSETLRRRDLKAAHEQRDKAQAEAGSWAMVGTMLASGKVPDAAVVTAIMNEAHIGAAWMLEYVERREKLEAAQERIAQLEREVRSAADIAIEEHEASICPEDFGCAEYTTSLSRQIEQQQRDIAAEREAIAREIRCETCNCAAANGKCEWCQFADKIEQGGFAPQNIRDSRIANAQKGDGE